MCSWQSVLVKKKKDQNLAMTQTWPSESGQMLLPTEPLERWHWSRGHLYTQFDSQARSCVGMY